MFQNMLLEAVIDSFIQLFKQVGETKQYYNGNAKVSPLLFQHRQGVDTTCMIIISFAYSNIILRRRVRFRFKEKENDCTARSYR